MGNVFLLHGLYKDKPFVLVQCTCREDFDRVWGVFEDKVFAHESLRDVSFLAEFDVYLE